MSWKQPRRIHQLAACLLFHQFLTICWYHQITLTPNSPILDKSPQPLPPEFQTEWVVQNDDDYGIENKEAPRLFLNWTIWSTDLATLEATSLMEEFRGTARIGLSAQKRQCQRNGTSNTLPDCPISCSSKYWTDQRQCTIPDYVIDPKHFWKGLPKPIIVLHNITNMVHPPQDIFLTSWDMIAQAHQSVPAEYIQQQSCHMHDEKRQCPNACLWSEPETFWDDRDDLCKSIQAAQLERMGRLWVGRCDCKRTCFTPAANGLNSSWPWRTESLRQEYHGPRRTPHEEWLFLRDQTMRQVQRSLDEPHPYFVEAGSCSLTPQWNISDTTPPLDHLYFIPQAKLIFCSIPKVGQADWIQLFRKILGAGDYRSLPSSKIDTSEFRMSQLPRAKVQQLWKDPTWTRAVIWRNPAERLLSAYLDQVVENGYANFRNRDGRITFAEFVHLVANATQEEIQKDHHLGIHHRVDSHWRPQLFACGMDYSLPLYDFVGSFDHLASHSRLLLQRVGLWESHGREFDTNTPENGDICMLPPPRSESGDVWIGFNQPRPKRSSDGRDSACHEAEVRDRMDDYYTPELKAWVQKAYSLDYAVWDDLKARFSKHPDKTPSGWDLSLVQGVCHGQ